MKNTKYIFLILLSVSLLWVHGAQAEKVSVMTDEWFPYVSMLNNAGVAVDFSSNASISFRKLYIGLVDLVPENEFVGWGLIQKYFPDEMYKFTTAENALSEDTLHLIVSKAFPRSSELLERFNAGLKKIHDKGVFKDLVRKYMQKVKINMPSSPY